MCFVHSSILSSQLLHCPQKFPLFTPFLFVLSIISELNERQREILEELAKEEINHGDNSPSQENW